MPNYLFACSVITTNTSLSSQCCVRLYCSSTIALQIMRTNKGNKPTKPKRTRKPRRQLPANKAALYIGLGEVPTSLDIVSGRGGGSNHHGGNQRLWNPVLMHRPRYRLLQNKAEKTAMAESIIQDLIRDGSRFLQKEPETGRWFTLPETIVIDKIKQALRDRYVPLFARNEETSDVEEPMLTSLPLPPPPELSSTDLMAFNTADFESLLKPYLASTDLSQQQFVSTADSVKEHTRNSPSLSITEFLNRHKPNDDSVSHPNGFKSLSSDAFNSLNSLGSMASFSRPFQSFSRSQNVPSTDDFKIQIGKLNRGCLDRALKGHSLDLMASVDGAGFPVGGRSVQNSYAVPKKLSSYFQAKFDEAFHSSVRAGSSFQAV